MSSIAELFVNALRILSRDVRVFGFHKFAHDQIFIINNGCGNKSVKIKFEIVKINIFYHLEFVYLIIKNFISNLNLT